MMKMVRKIIILIKQFFCLHTTIKVNFLADPSLNFEHYTYQCKKCGKFHNRVPSYNLINLYSRILCFLGFHNFEYKSLHSHGNGILSMCHFCKKIRFKGE